jgi:hypothetical protein
MKYNYFSSKKMFAHHASSSVKNENRPYVIFYSPCGYDKLPDWIYTKPTLKTISLDVGIVNLSVRIEVRSPEGIIPLYFRRIDLKKLCDNTTNTTGTCNVGPDILEQANKFIFDLLDGNKDKNVGYLHDADLVVIERQLPDNIKATKMFQHFISTLILLISLGYIPKDIVVTDIDSKRKYTQLGCPTEYNTHAKKKWGMTKAREILEQRGDNWSLEVLRNNQGKAETKADDLADTVTQMEAWFICHSK